MFCICEYTKRKLNFMKTIFEVGANTGEDIQRYLYDDENIIYAFEAAPHLYFDLIRRFKNEKRLCLFNAAVDETNGFRKFNIAHEQGCHSLHDFVENVTQKWEGHNELVHYDSIQNLPCMRLDSFMDLYNIKKIDFLEIDTQGNDWNVLKSLGDRIDDVVEGKCEAAYNLSLYKAENDWKDIKRWLESKDFEVRVIPHPTEDVEVDLVFYRKHIFYKINL
jgi:FkbM family methyltransferase